MYIQAANFGNMNEEYQYIIVSNCQYLYTQIKIFDVKIRDFACASEKYYWVERDCHMAWPLVQHVLVR